MPSDTKKLFKAIKNKTDKTEVVKLIKHVNYLSAEKGGRKVLQYAWECGNWEVIEAIIDLRNKEPHPNYYGYGFILFEAVFNKRFELAEKLLELGAITSRVSINNEFSVVHWAVEYNKPELIKKLIRYKIKIIVQDNNQYTPFEQACILGHWNCAQILCDPTIQIRKKFPPEVIQSIVLGKQAIIAQKVFKLGSLPNESLFWAIEAINAATKNEDMVIIHCIFQFILFAEVNQAIVNAAGKTPIILAAELGHWKIVHLLLDAIDPKVGLKELNLDSILIQAISIEDYTIVKKILTKKTSWNTHTSEHGNPFLYSALCVDNGNIFKLLLKRGANPKLKNQNAETTFDIAKKLNAVNCLHELWRGDKITYFSNLIQFYKKWNLTIEQYRQELTELYQYIQETKLSTIETILIIKCMLLVHNKVFKINIEQLKQYKDQLTSINTQSIYSSPDIERLNSLITIFQQLLSDQNSIQFVLMINSLEELDIQNYAIHKHEINDFANRIHIFLAETKIEFENKFPEKNTLTFWEKSRPECIVKIINLLDMPQTPGIELIFRKYVSLIKELNNKESRIIDLTLFKNLIERAESLTYYSVYKIENPTATPDYLGYLAQTNVPLPLAPPEYEFLGSNITNNEYTVTSLFPQLGYEEEENRSYYTVPGIT